MAESSPLVANGGGVGRSVGSLPDWVYVYVAELFMDSTDARAAECCKFCCKHIFIMRSRTCVCVHDVALIRLATGTQLEHGSTEAKVMRQKRKSGFGDKRFRVGNAVNYCIGPGKFVTWSMRVLIGEK